MSGGGVENNWEGGWTFYLFIFFNNPFFVFLGFFFMIITFFFCFLVYWLWSATI